MTLALAAEEVALPKKRSRVLSKFLKNRSAVLGGVIVLFFILVAVVAPLIAPYDPIKPSFTTIRKAPSALFWFGTDELGRDMFSRMVWGARASLMARIRNGIANIASVAREITASVQPPK
jgi:ABC-type dipeptide/oligopeptide/nickel transport system permease subunit